MCDLLCLFTGIIVLNNPADNCWAKFMFVSTFPASAQATKEAAG